jgi:proline iminopeptidase
MRLELRHAGWTRGFLVAAVMISHGCSPSPPAIVEAEQAAASISTEGLRAINGTELFVKRIGDGPPIVVVHGGPVLEHGYLLPHLEPLARDHELILYDQRLCGRSAASVDPETVRIATFVDDIEALRDDLGFERIHLMAHSWGGLLGLHYAIEHPDRLSSLVLLDPMSASTDLWQKEQAAVADRFTAEDRAAREALTASPSFAAREPAAIHDLLMLTFRAQFHDRAKADRLELFVPEDYASRSEQFGALGPDLADYDLHDRLRAVSVPTLIVYGSDEPGLGLGGAALHDALPDSRLFTIDASGHFPFIEQPELFLDVVRTFLGGVERSEPLQE